MAGCPRFQGVLAALLVRPLIFHLAWKIIFFFPSHAALGLGKSLFPLFARSLDLAPHFFDDKVRTRQVTWAILYGTADDAA
jgi:hypothetical protein